MRNAEVVILEEQDCILISTDQDKVKIKREDIKELIVELGYGLVRLKNYAKQYPKP